MPKRRVLVLRPILGVRWDRLWRLAAPGVAGALRVALRVVAIVTVAGAGPALLVPRVPTKFWYLATGILSLIAWGFGGVVNSSYVVGALAIVGVIAMPFLLSALWALLGGTRASDD